MTQFYCSNLWQENNLSDGVGNQKRAYLRLMNFSTNEIEFAMSKLGMLEFLLGVLLCLYPLSFQYMYILTFLVFLICAGENAEINEIVEFIVAAQISRKLKDTNGTSDSRIGINEVGES